MLEIFKKLIAGTQFSTSIGLFVLRMTFCGWLLSDGLINIIRVLAKTVDPLAARATITLAGVELMCALTLLVVFAFMDYLSARLSSLTNLMDMVMSDKLTGFPTDLVVTTAVLNTDPRVAARSVEL